MPQLLKSKEEALQACAEQHHALVTCFKTCSFASSFKGCCTAEHKAFWECYTRERGTNQTKVTSWLDGLFSGEAFSKRGSSGDAAAPASQQPPQQQQQQVPAQQQQQQQQQAEQAQQPPQQQQQQPQQQGRRWWRWCADFFLQHSELRQRDAAGAEAVLLPRGAVAGPLLLEAQARAPPGSRLWLELHPDARTGAPKDQLADVPVYAHPKAVVRGDGTVEALEITYITIYAYNGPYRVGGMPFLQTGAHDGDIEHCTARVHHATGELLSFWYNAHRSRDGCWAAAPYVPRCRDGSIAAYVAKHGHGVYPSPGRVYRHFYLGNDLCSGRGPVWRPRHVVLLPPLEHDEADDSPAAISQHRGGAVPLDAAQESSASDSAECGIVQGLGSLSLGPADPQQQQQQQGGEPGARAAGQSSSGSGNSGAATTSAAAPRRNRKLPHVSSRGSGLAGGAGSDASDGQTLDSSSLPTVVLDDPCHWLGFSGDWGGDGPPGPAFQGWYHSAECPISRSPLLRVVGHFVGEPERV